ncbi:MAG: transposase [Chloroflexaceae bacterium]|nr:transposase [Chloroflexaceae bacterium]
MTMADHLEGVSHDTIGDGLRRERHTARTLWELACPLLQNSSQAYLIVDDSVLTKRYSEKIDLVKRQYRGTEHRLVRGIGVVNLVHSTGQTDDFYPIDYRISAPCADGKTKNDHFREMLIAAVADTQWEAQTMLFDIWYASAEHLKLVHRLGRTFYTTVKPNRRT